MLAEYNNELSQRAGVTESSQSSSGSSGSDSGNGLCRHLDGAVYISACSTKMDTIVFMHKWNVSQFSVQQELSSPGDFIESNVFGSTDHDYRFRLKLFPCGKDEECRGYLSLFLQIFKCPSAKLRFRVNFYIEAADGPRGCALNKNVVTINRGGIVTASKFFSTETLKIHLSFSQGGSSGGKQLKDKALKPKETIQVPPIQSEFINVFLKSIGVTVTEIQDVVFKLAFFEREYAFYTASQLQSEITGHYTSQIVKQLYVLVLGLDILGNPFGLVRDLSAGVQDFFYQPFQGAVQGPEEFAEGVALGVKGLVGATVGGGVGAVSRIAGTLGKGVAALTLDEEYQRKRQQMMNRRPKTIGEGVARGVKSVGQGFYEGITGVVFKPLTGARTGGAGGFAKGLSLGLVGVFTRPLSGAVDFASSTLDAVRTATVGIDEMKPLRPSRVIFSDNIVRPYCQKVAIGAQVFREADNGSVADTDYFVAHAPISEKSLFIITDRRAMNVRKNDIVGSWNIEWQVLYTEMNRPTLSGRSILIDLRKKQKGFLKLSTLGGRVIELTEQASASEIYHKLLIAYEIEVGDD